MLLWYISKISEKNNKMLDENTKMLDRILDENIKKEEAYLQECDEQRHERDEQWNIFRKRQEDNFEKIVASYQKTLQK